ncbi:hypothetical protein D3C72_2410860 [compost metagenome]
MAVHRIDGRLVIGDPYNAQYRPKDLFAIDTHIRLDVIEQGTAHVVTLWITRHLIIAAIDHQRCALFNANINVPQHFFLMGG